MHNYYIGHSSDSDVRYKATSGGVGTSVIKYLLSHNIYGTALDFSWDSTLLCYKPKLIYRHDELSQCGSIYHDIDTISFIRASINQIKDGIVVTCLPCQVKPIKKILSANNIKHFIITFACSGQNEIEGTYKFYELAHITKNDVAYMKYRGNGWPSGIQVILKNNDKLFFPNYSEPWKSIHRSQLYSAKRCFLCTLDTSYDADISLADPWLDKYKTDTIGHTLFIANTTLGNEIIALMKRDQELIYEECSPEDWSVSQSNNVNKKVRVTNNRKFLIFKRNLCSNSIYRWTFSRSTKALGFHIKLLYLINKYCYNK